jgi:hypothetical protein
MPPSLHLDKACARIWTIFTPAWKKSRMRRSTRGSVCCYVSRPQRPASTDSGSWDTATDPFFCILPRFTNAMLHTTVSLIDYIFSPLGPDIHLAAPQLGLLMLPIYSQSAYWAGVHDHLQTLPQVTSRRGHPITAIVLLVKTLQCRSFSPY